MAKFDLGNFVKTMSVPDSGTAGQEQIEYLPLAELHEDERNFYTVDKVEELAANIQSCGLMDPLRVRKSEDGYTIVSGHRRATALRLLAAEDSKFETVACIIETGDIPEQLQELRLIFSNSATREMSPADEAKQAERVEVLLYELKEQGMEFPGRMRDRVAEACRISRSKLGRLKKIQRNLAPCYKPLWDAGELPEDTADALASMPEEVQERIKRVFPKKTPSGGAVRNIAGKMASGQDYCAVDFKCPDGSPCDHLDKFFKHDLSCSSRENCNGKKCCLKCSAGGKHDPAGGSYNAACALMCGKAKDKYERAKEKSKAKAEKASLDARNEAVRKGMADAQRLVRAADAAGLPDDSKIKCEYSNLALSVLRDIAQGRIPNGMAGYQLCFLPWKTSSLLAMAETLHCSADYLLGLVDEPRATVSGALPEQTTVGCWMPGSTTPDHPCECYVMLDVSEMNMKEPAHRSEAYWAGEAFRIKPSAYAEKIPSFPVLAWLEIPEWKGGNGDA